MGWRVSVVCLNSLAILLKTAHIVAFGGDGFYSEPLNRLSAKFVLDLTGKERPKICFIPTASGDEPGYIQKFYERYSTDFCEPTHLTLFNREVKDLRSFLLGQDVIYVGGGNTANMLAIWRVQGVEDILKEAYHAGTVMCGTSAGSLCWFEAGVTDSFGRDLAPLFDGLGLIRASNCPHYDSESLREPQYKKFILEGLPAGYAADDGTALHFANGEFVEAIGSRPGVRAFHVSKSADEGSSGELVVQTPIPVRYLGGS
jgi:peptidase E